MQTPAEILFWDVDTQVDFIREDGALAVPGAEGIVPNLARLTEAAREHGIPVVASADDHGPADAEISDDPDFSDTYPPHCMHGTPGQERIPETQHPEAVVIGHGALPAEEVERRVREAPGAVLVLKKRFDVFTNPNTEAVLAALTPNSVVLYGVALDVCNRYAVEGLLARGQRNLAVVIDAVAALDDDRGEALLKAWRDRGVELITTDEALARLPKPAAV